MVETKINKEGLENALKVPQTEETPEVPKVDAKPVEKAPEQMKPEEEIGFHKGAITTLANERTELMKMIQNVEVIMQAHVKRLEELGVKIVKK
ncbi:MAG: hypothetical protein KC516_00850 [Nanoarchaeota archaeon]|nr:hypothetical protein [Nanoarchaeota archaeon]